MWISKLANPLKRPQTIHQATLKSPPKSGPASPPLVPTSPPRTPSHFGPNDSPAEASSDLAPVCADSTAVDKVHVAHDEPDPLEVTKLSLNTVTVSMPPYMCWKCEVRENAFYSVSEL